MRLALLFLFTFMLTACASAPATRNTASDATIDALHARIEAATLRFDVALNHYQQGDISAAAEEYGIAREELRTVADACLKLPGCDASRVIAAQDALLVRQGRYLVGLTADAMPDDRALPLEGEGDSPVLQWMPEAERTVALLNGKDLAKVIKLNAQVKAALEEWLTWMRPQLLDTWENYQYMRHRMFPEYEKTGLPEALLFGILAKESGGRVHAVSRAGAAGPLQFMPATGLRFGLSAASGFDTRFDPALSARANAAYLNERFAELNGNLSLALAAYNGGEGRVARLSGKGARDFWNPQVFNALPAETREYVPMVLAAAWLFLHPEQYNLELPVYATTAVEVQLDQELSLNELAICLGQSGNARGWFRHVRNLNPRWEAGQRLPQGTTIELPNAAHEAYLNQCRSGAMLALSRDLHDARPAATTWRSPAAGSSVQHVVKQGDSLHSIAKRRGCSVQDIARVNNIAAPKYLIKPGQRLSLPACRQG